MNHHPSTLDPLVQRVLRRIEHDNVAPRPRWEFLLKNYVFWGLGMLAVALGAFAFSATLFEITNVDWRLSSATHIDFISFFFAAAPIFWVVTLTLFVLIVYINIRYTNHGYRYPLWLIAFGAVLLSLSIGTGIYVAGFGGEVEEIVGDHPPFYRPILAAQQSWWTAPEKGLLVGQVTQTVKDTTTFVLKDFSDRTWHVDSSDLSTRDLVTIERGGNVRIVGTPILTTATSTAFHACFVFPWETHGDTRTAGLPRPLATISTTTERNRAVVRSEVCKGIRPYQQLHSIDGDDGL